MDIKLLILDIDGTIAGVSNQINQRVIDTIKAVQYQGINVTIATGRMFRSALRFYQIINGNLPLICYNGAWIQCPSTNKIYSHIPLESEIGLQLLEYFETHKFRRNIEIHCYCDDNLYVKEITEKTKIYAQRSGIQPILIDQLQTIVKQSSTKILAICYIPEIITQIKQEITHFFDHNSFYLTQSSPIYLELTNPLVNKGNATRYLTEKILNLQPENVMAIGDNLNDWEMLQYAGLSIAMGDAPPQLKSIVQWVAPSVENNGVAVAIEKFLL